MSEMLAALTNIRTAEDMVVAFRDEEQCRRLLESMVWPAGRVCPACGYKRSIAIDLKSDAGKDVARRLIARADVVMENFRPGVFAKLGFDQQTLDVLARQELSAL